MLLCSIIRATFIDFCSDNDDDDGDDDHDNNTSMMMINTST